MQSRPRAFNGVVSRFASTAAAAPERSFDAFVADCSTRLLRAAFLLCGERQAAEDLLQLTMIRTARHWRGARRSPEAYARVVLLNAARDRARRARRRVSELPLALDDGSSARSPSTDDPAETLASRELILGALAALPQRQREVIVLRFYADLSVADTAAAIGAAEGTVLSYTSRALSRLRELLTDQPADAQDPAETEVHHGHR
jgi:RNA polymerase sigma-70 factor (sigma-E family)